MIKKFLKFYERVSLLYKFHAKMLLFLLFNLEEFMKMKSKLHEARFEIEKYTMT